MFKQAKDLHRGDYFFLRDGTLGFVVGLAISLINIYQCHV